MAGFFVSRFFLGVTESGLFPGVVFSFSMWYKRRERQYRISLFFSAASLAGAFGGILAYVSISLPRPIRGDGMLTEGLGVGDRAHEGGGLGEWLEMDLHTRKSSRETLYSLRGNTD
jgi:hypothetical protein